MKWLRNSSFCSLNLIQPIIMSPHSERHHSLYCLTINYSQQEYLKLELPNLRWMYATKASNHYCMSSKNVQLISAFKMTFRMTFKNGISRGFPGMTLKGTCKGTSSQVQARSRSILSQVWFCFISLELDSEVGRLVLFCRWKSLMMQKQSL